MRVLHLTPEFPPVIWGGLGTAVGGLATASARAGLSVGVLLIGGVLVIGNSSYGNGNLFWDRTIISDESLTFGRDGVFFLHVSPQEAEEAGIRFVRKWKPGVLHLHTAWLWPIARAIRDQTETPLVFTVHSLDRAEYEIGDFVTDWNTQEQVITAADRVIALSESEYKFIAKYCPAAKKRVRIVGNGIDNSLKSRVTHAKKETELITILYSGRFVDRKGIRELFQSIPLILNEKPNVHFVLAGGYGTALEIERTWLDHSLFEYRNKIQFTGWLTPDEVAELYKLVDILVVPSWYEPFGMVILEGMLHGLCIAATSVGGPSDILEHQKTALLFPPQNVEALKETLLELISDSALRDRLGKEAFHEVRRKWLWPGIVKKIRGVYLEAIQSRNGPI